METLLSVFRALMDRGATVIVIEHDLAVMRSADYIVDMGPGGGRDGGTIVATGTPWEITQVPSSLTGACLAGRLKTDA